MRRLLTIALISALITLQGCGLPIAALVPIAVALGMGGATAVTYYAEHMPSPTPTPDATPTPAPSATPTPVPK